MIEKIRQWLFNLCYRPMTEEEKRRQREVLLECDTCGYHVKGTEAGVGNVCRRFVREETPHGSKITFVTMKDCPGRFRLVGLASFDENDSE